MALSMKGFTLSRPGVPKPCTFQRKDWHLTMSYKMNSEPLDSPAWQKRLCTLETLGQDKQMMLMLWYIVSSCFCWPGASGLCHTSLTSRKGRVGGAWRPSSWGQSHTQEHHAPVTDAQHNSWTPSHWELPWLATLSSLVTPCCCLCQLHRQSTTGNLGLVSPVLCPTLLFPFLITMYILLP